MDFMITAEMEIRRRNVSDLKTGDAVQTVGFWTAGFLDGKTYKENNYSLYTTRHQPPTGQNKHSLNVLQDHTCLENDVRGATCH